MPDSLWFAPFMMNFAPRAIAQNLPNDQFVADERALRMSREYR